MRLSLAVVVAASAIASSPCTALQCLGEYEFCPLTGSCALDPLLCTACSEGEYVCPMTNSCVSGAEGVSKCPDLEGTHLDPSLSLDARVAYIANATTTEEKIRQLQNSAPSILRLGVPEYQWLNDDEHQVKQNAATAFPSGCNLGPSFNRTLLNEVGAAIALEARALHHQNTNAGIRGVNPVVNGIGLTAYSPNLNVVRDPRWGRAQEVYGEDPALMSGLVKAFVDGLQHANDTSAPYPATVACCKHYAAYDIESIPIPRYFYNAEVDVRNMWETYMPAFEACVVDAGAYHVMCSYNSLNGVPTCADPGLLNDILRDRWGFEGFVVSDYDAWANLVNTHFICPDQTCAAALGLNAGMDQEGGGNASISMLPEALAAGDVTLDRITQAFSRLFRVRIQLGMLDPPTSVSWNNVVNSTSLVQGPDHLELAREAARQGVGLYQNNGGVLPFKNGGMGNILLTGPHANSTVNLLGNYIPFGGPTKGVASLVDVFTARGNNVTYEPGCPDAQCSTGGDFGPACTAAKTADAVIVALGLDQTMESEGHDRSTIDLPPLQNALLRGIRAATRPGTPVVVVLVHGGTLDLGNVTAYSDAVLDAWYPGEMGAYGIADVVFGDYNPAGRASVTYYSANSDLPPMQTQNLYPDPSVPSNGLTYRYTTSNVTVPFGHGLSYTSFAYSGLTTNATAGQDPLAPIAVTVSVKNTGATDGDEVVQLYVQQVNSTVPAPQVRLADFTRVHIPSGGTVQVQLVVQPVWRSVVQENAPDIYHGQYTILPGTVEFFVGGGQPAYYEGGVSTHVDFTQGGTLPIPSVQ